ncbi:hypothetical protein H8356DRAFT_1032307 [Neocallimastix lanati (nom. inval.)]|nr:hypothetical protein H8356DRAFT_1032307 [Neocallimastix sp. JGI-2020a]
MQYKYFKQSINESSFIFNMSYQKRIDFRIYLLFLFIFITTISGIFYGLIKSGVLRLKFVGNSKQVDEIDSKLSFQISIPLAILFIVTIYLFNKKKNHHLINYRPLILCKIAAIGSAIYCVVLPILLSYSERLFGEYRHFVILGFTLIFAPMTILASMSRYVKLFLLNRRDIGRMKLYNNSQNSIFSGNDSNFEPNEYLKRLNKLSRDSRLVTFSPIIFITSISLLFIPYLYLELYKTLNFVNQFDIISSFVTVSLASVLFMCTLFRINDKDGLTTVKSSSLFFIIPTFFTFFNAICIPLIEVFISNRKLKGKKMLNKKEFTKLLLGSRYIESLKSTAIKCYCVETVLFWDMHLKLMKKVNEALSKNEHQSDESIIAIKQNGFTCTNISSPIPTNYDLLLDLNKNIFGSDNNTILYAGCNYNNINDINHFLVNSTLDSRGGNPEERNISMNRSRGGYPEEKKLTMNELRGGYHEERNTSMNRSRGGYPEEKKLTMNEMRGGYHEERNTSMNRSRSRSEDRNLSMNRSRGRTNNFDCHNNYGNSTNDFSIPSVTVYNDNTIPPRRSNPYSKSIYHHQKNENSISQFSNFSYPNSSSYLDSSTNSEMVELLYNNEPVNLTINRSLERGNINHAFSVASSSTLINNKTYSKPTHIRNNSLNNINTDIFYELFHVNPEHVELPTELWHDYKYLYYSFISDRSLATINLDTNIINSIEKSIKNNNYTIDMFFPAISETVDLIYQNFYPKLLMK